MDYKDIKDKYIILDKDEFNVLPEPYNLSTYYLLPSIKLGYIDFGEDNYINSYITPSFHVAVEVKDTGKVLFKYPKHMYFHAEYEWQGRNLILFRLNSGHYSFVLQALDGRYTFRNFALLQLVMDYSGLPQGHRFRHALVRTEEFKQELFLKYSMDFEDYEYIPKLDLNKDFIDLPYYLGKDGPELKFP